MPHRKMLRAFGFQDFICSGSAMKVHTFSGGLLVWTLSFRIIATLQPFLYLRFEFSDSTRNGSSDASVNAARKP
jgi:hypothetical protein